MKVYDAIISRRTIRKFQQKPIKLTSLKRILNAGRLAPSAGNLQPLDYVIAVDSTVREKIFTNVRWAGYIRPRGDPGDGEKPTAYIIICVNKENLLVPYYKYDVGASAENITLAALEKGIGCCWIGSFRRKKIENILKIPGGYRADLVLALGYPLEDPVHFEIGKNQTIVYHKDASGVLHVPKRKLDDIAHINYF